MNVPVSTRELRRVEDSPPLVKAQASLDSHEWRQLDAYWRAANYLSVGQIYLYENPMLREPLTLAHVKPLVVGHWVRHRGRISSMCISIARSSCTIST